MKSFIFATITGFALTLTFLSQLSDRQPAAIDPTQEITDAPLQTILPEASDAAPTAAQPTAAPGTTTNSATLAAPVATTVTAPATTTTTPALPTPQTLTAPANALYSMADVEKAYATFYANRTSLAKALAAKTAELNQSQQYRARLPQQDQWNPAHPVNQAINALQSQLRQIQAAVSMNAQSAFFEMATYVAAIRVGLPMESLKRSQELLLVVAKDTFSSDWSQGVYTQQTAATQPDFMLNQTPATAVSAPVGPSPQMVSLPVTPTPAPFGATTVM